MNNCKKLCALLIALVFNGVVIAIEPLQPFSWGTIIEKQPPLNSTPGQQILHFKTSDKPYNLNQQATSFVNEHFKHAVELNSDASALRFASDNVKIEGVYIELGVCTGRT